MLVRFVCCVRVRIEMICEQILCDDDWVSVFCFDFLFCSSLFFFAIPCYSFIDSIGHFMRGDSSNERIVVYNASTHYDYTRLSRTSTKYIIFLRMGSQATTIRYSNVKNYTSFFLLFASLYHFLLLSLRSSPVFSSSSLLALFSLILLINHSRLRDCIASSFL